MIRQRNFATVFLLSIITCGIYFFYFLYTTTRDMNIMVGNGNRNTDPGIVVLLSLVTCGLYDLFWYYEQGERIKDLCDRNQVPCSDNGVTYLLFHLLGYLTCSILSWVGLYLFIKNFNNLAFAYNSAMFGTKTQTM